MSADRFDPHGKCLICGRDFRSDGCPHGTGENEAFIAQRDLDARVRKIVRDELAKAPKAPDALQGARDPVLRRPHLSLLHGGGSSGSGGSGRGVGMSRRSDGHENRMVINGGDRGPDWEYDEDAETPELTKEQEMAADIERLESNCKESQGRIDELMGGIRDFLGALDRGYFGADLTRVDLSDSAFVSALRGLAGKLWARPKKEVSA